MIYVMRSSTNGWNRAQNALKAFAKPRTTETTRPRLPTKRADGYARREGRLQTAR